MVLIRKRMQWLVGLLGLALLMTAQPAMAEGIPGLSFPVPGGDKSLEMIGSFLGGSGGMPGSADVMKALMLVFNGAILSLASIVAFYTIVSAVVQTAHDGEVLGKRYSSLWVPIRAATGIAAIVPAGGFSAVQMLILWVAVQGVGLADALYNVGIDAVTSRGGFVRPVVMSDSGKDIVAGMAKISACVAVNEAEIAKAGEEGYSFRISSTRPNDGVPTAENGYKPLGPEKTVLNAEFIHPNSKSTSCGLIVFTVPDAEGEVGSAIARSVYEAQVAAATEALTAAANAMREASAGSSQETADAAAKAINAAAVAYNDVVNKAVARGVESGAAKAKVLYEREVAELKRGGWATAGGSFMSLTKFSAQISPAALADAVSVRASNVNVLGNIENDASIKGKIDNLSKMVTTQNAAIGGSAPEDTETGLVARKMREIWDSALFNPFKTWLKSMTSDMSGGNPLSEVKSLGDFLLTAVAGIVVLILVLQTAAGSAIANVVTGGASGAVSSAIASMMAFFSFLLIGMLTMGITMSIYIPLVPYIIWLSVLISWMIAVAEAVIASPLWMMMHINPEGEGFSTGATDAGYKFVAAVFLRPGLSVIAFFVASSIMFAIGGFVNATFFSVVSANQSGSTTGLFSFLGFMFVYTAICITLVQKSFALCLTIPEAILRWIGSSLTGGENMEGSTHSTFAGAAGTVSHAGTQTMNPRGRKPKVDGGDGNGTGKTAADTPTPSGEVAELQKGGGVQGDVDAEPPPPRH